LKFTLTHRDSAKKTAELGAGLQPNVACEFKRAGFLEGEREQCELCEYGETAGDLRLATCSSDAD